MTAGRPRPDGTSQPPPPRPGAAAAPAGAGYQREVGPFSATMLIAGSMIGSGVFSVSPAAIREAAPTHPRRPRGLR